ncbi:helix-turn-helix domain-containing protein [Spirillospora sp. CA-128828]|uniref:helix-turn-helix domain-containing protein n=1 Tax=Spirillospora sp. CA-128828 TaxID=3240033 RepID=UPI003D9397AC
MPEREPANPRSSVWDLVGYYLRFLRKSKGLNGADVARLAECATSTISRIETGEQRITEKQAAKIDKAWKTGNLFELLIYYARRASDPDWFKNLTKHEQKATELRIFGALHVPGLVQTPEYARALLESGRNKNVERSLESRMGRQEVLTRPTPPDLWVTVTENVLDWPVGSPAVMVAQLTRLLELSRLPNVVVRVVPRRSGASEALDGPFQVVRTPEEVLAFVEAAVEGRLVSEEDDVDGFRNRFDRINAKALPEDLSRELILRKMEMFNAQPEVA